MPAEGLPTGWEKAGATPLRRVAINTLIAIDGGLQPFDYGIHEVPTSTDATQPAVLLPTGTGQVDVDELLFNGVDPDLAGGLDPALGGIKEIRMVNFPFNATSITIDGTTYTPSGSGGSTLWPPAGVVLNSTITNGELISVDDVITVDPSGREDVTILYRVYDVSNASNIDIAKIIIPIDVVKWNGTAWENGFGPDGTQGTIDDGPPGPGDDGNTVYILNEDISNDPTIALLEETAKIGDLIFENDNAKCTAQFRYKCSNCYR